MPDPYAPAPRYADSVAGIYDMPTATDYVRRVLDWQIREIEMQPSNDREIAAARARDARTLNELVRTLERLNALEKTRAGEKRKTKAAEDAELKEKFVRRLDQLLTAGPKADIAGKP